MPKQLEQGLLDGNDFADVSADDDVDDPNTYEGLDGTRHPIAKLMNTDHKVGLTSAEGARRVSVFGKNVLSESHSNKWVDLAKCFWGPMPIMIWAAIIVEAIIAVNEPKEWGDFSVLMVLQVLNAVIGWHEDQKAGDAVAALKAALKAKATVMRDGKWDTGFDADGPAQG